MRSVRIWFNKKDTAKYISHLDITRCMTRAFRRTDIPLWYTEGFNPHPYLMFGQPLPLGVEALREPLDIRLNDDSYPDERVVEQLNSVMVPGMEFIEIKAPQFKATEIFSADYVVEIPDVADPRALAKRIADVVEAGNITYEKKVKKGGFKTINASEHIKDFKYDYTKDTVKLSFNLPAGNDFTINPVSFCNALFAKLGESGILHRITRCRILMKDGTEFR